MKWVIFLSLFSSGFSQEYFRAERLSNQVKGIVQKSQCATCHTENRPTTNTDALNVFNLSKENWKQGMSLAQMERLVWSLNGASPEEVASMVGRDIEVRPLKEHEKVLLDQFMKYERDKRKESPLYDIMNF